MKEIYIDLDRTILNTDRLYYDMDKTTKKYGISLERFNKVKNQIFTEPILFNYVKVIEYICNNDNINLKILDELNKILDNCDNYLYEDVQMFFKNCKQKGYKINILTYGDLNFQLMKLKNLSIYKSIDSVIISSIFKFDLNLNYTNKIFIDDNPRDLIGLYNKKAKVIRLIRENCKYSKIKLNEKIITCHNLNDIKL